MLQRAKPSTDESIRIIDPFEDFDALWPRIDDVQEEDSNTGVPAREPGNQASFGARPEPEDRPHTSVTEPADASPAAEGRAADAPRLLPISELDMSLVGRVRAGVSEDVVDDYVYHLGDLPPVRVTLTDEGGYVVVGGLHRIQAHERAGRTEVACTVERMSRAEAVLAAAADNRAHGARLTRADTRAVIGLLLTEAGTSRAGTSRA
jgi:hypothetical protein